MNDGPELSYSSHFRQHLAQVRAHLAGIDGDDPPPSFISPTGYWTPSEKNVFFHSLGIFSRFRPDLIAETIVTKSVVDVCAYIDSLDDAIARDRRLLLPRSDLPSSVEVSNAWVQREEGMAEDIIPFETIWTRDSLVLQREEEVSSWKASHAAAKGLEAGAADEALEIWEHDRRRHWRQDDALSKLDCHHLKVMERMLRDAETGHADVEGALAEDQDTEPVPLLPSNAEPSDRPPQISFIGNEMIDPVLLQLSGLPASDQPLIKDPPSQRHPEHLPQDMLAFSAASLPSPQAPAPLVTQPLESSRFPSPVDDRETAIDNSGLSPASRRRIQKRLHMRRKRAAQRGGVVIEDLTKLRPGRKAKDQKAPKPHGESDARRDEPVQPDGGEAEEDAQMNIDQNGGGPALSTNLMPPEEAEGNEDDGDDSDAPRGHRRSTSGMTKPYKIKKDFATMGIDADTLIDRNLGLFHLSTLSKLMTIYKSGYDAKGSNAATTISIDTIRLLSAVLVEFVTEGVHRSILTCKQEISMKSSIKVYHRISDAITAENVAQALEMMGTVAKSKEEYFAQLLGEDLESSAANEADEADEANDDEEQSEAGVGDGNSDQDNAVPETTLLESPTAFPLLLPLHRETCPPLVWLPKSLLPRIEPRSGPVPIAEDQLMPNETDEEQLLDELDEEMDLDAAEQVLAYECEADLWKTFGK